MNKDDMERICRSAGMRPEKRETVHGYDVFIADGFSSIPWIVFRRFGVEPGEFPFGAYVTIWWIGKGEELDVGLPLIFDAFHDLHLPSDARQPARVNRAMVDAADFLTRRKRIRADA